MRAFAATSKAVFPDAVMAFAPVGQLDFKHPFDGALLLQERFDNRPSITADVLDPVSVYQFVESELLVPTVGGL